MLSETGTHPVLASAAPFAAGLPGKKIDGSAPVGMSGIPLIPEASALPAFISGLRLSASHAADGRRIRTGILIRENARR